MSEPWLPGFPSGTAVLPTSVTVARRDEELALGGAEDWCLCARSARTGMGIRPRPLGMPKSEDGVSRGALPTARKEDGGVELEVRGMWGQELASRLPVSRAGIERWYPNGLLACPLTSEDLLRALGRGRGVLGAGGGGAQLVQRPAGQRAAAAVAVAAVAGVRRGRKGGRAKRGLAEGPEVRGPHLLVVPPLAIHLGVVQRLVHHDVGAPQPLGLALGLPLLGRPLSLLGLLASLAPGCLLLLPLPLPLPLLLPLPLPLPLLLLRRLAPLRLVPLPDRRLELLDLLLGCQEGGGRGLDVVLRVAA